MTLEQLPSPCALVDLDVLERNVDAAAHRARRLGVRLRPHVKTHACAEIARLQVAGHPGGITVSTVSEAEAFGEAGFDDQTLAVGVSPSGLRRAADLAGRVRALNLLVDGERAMAETERAGRARGLRLSVFVEVDCGDHRAGVDPEDPASARLVARAAASTDVALRGLITHAGQAYACRNREEILPVAETERRVVVDFARRLRDDGIDVPEVSVGSTPTFAVAGRLPGVTEVRPGNGAFFDAFQATIGSCSPEDVAFSVLCTVIGTYPDRGEVVVDAGALALSKDEGPVHVDPHCGFGWPCRLDGTRLAGARVRSLSQEHGVVTWPPGEPLPAWGSRLRIVPNHSCLAAACHSTYHVHRSGRVVAEWRPFPRH